MFAAGGGEGGRGGCEAAGDLGAAAAGVFEEAGGGLMLGGQAVGGLGAFAKTLLDGGERRGGTGCGLAGGVEGGFVAFAFGGEGGAFLGEAGGHGDGVAVEGGFAVAVGLQLGDL